MSLAKQDREVVRNKKLIFGSIAALSLYQMLGFRAISGFGIFVFLGVFLGSAFIVLRKRKPKSYEKLKKQAAQRKKLDFFKKSWVTTFIVGTIISLLGFSLLGDFVDLYKINDVLVNVLFPLYFYLIPVNLLIFLTGFLPDYDSAKQVVRRFLLAVFGLLLSILPFIIGLAVV